MNLGFTGVKYLTYNYKVGPVTSYKWGVKFPIRRLITSHKPRYKAIYRGYNLIYNWFLVLGPPGERHLVACLNKKSPYTPYKGKRSSLKKWMGKEDYFWEGRPYFHRQSVIFLDGFPTRGARTSYKWSYNPYK